jgi:DNA polymerase-4/DNA polymerase V
MSKKPKIILHLDGDSFFVACEVSLNPKLKNKPVITGFERGIATAMSQEAKKLGISRGMPVFKIKKLYPKVIIVNSNYHSYEMFSQRAFNIVRRYTPFVEEYSIDECFADLSNLSNPVKIAGEIKADLKRELGIIFSVGLGPTKVIAKVASKWNKPDRFTVIEPKDIPKFLKDLPMGKVWGIGPATSIHLQKLGIKTALELIERPEEWARDNLSKPELERWFELRGESVYKIHTEPNDNQASIQTTRTFPKTKNKEMIFSELSKNIEDACSRMRQQKLKSKKVYLFLKTQEFRYKRAEMSLLSPTDSPTTVLNAIRGSFNFLYDPSIEYRSSGITLSELTPSRNTQNDLFGEVVKNDKKNELFKVVDKLEKRFGNNIIQLSSSLNASKKRGLHAERRLWIPCMGEVV